MFKWFYNMSLKKKFYSVFGLIIAGSIIGIAIGQFAFAKVQVGGKDFKGIELKRDGSEDLARIRMNINLLRGMIYSNVHAYDEEAEKGMEKIIASTDELFGNLKNIRNKVNGRGVSCTTCHTDEQVSPFFSYVESGHASWNKYKGILKERLFPIATSGNMKAAVDIIEGEFADVYFEVMENTKISVDIMRGTASLQVKKLEKESDIILIGYVIYGLIIVVFLVGVASLLTTNFSGPVTSITQVSAQMAEGDFKSIDIKTKGKDEIGEMVESFTEMSARIGKVVSSIKGGIMNLSSASKDLAATAEDLNKNSHEQSLQTEQVASAMTEISQTVMDVAKNASDAVSASKDASSIALKGKKSVENTVNSMVEIAETIKETASTIEELGRGSNEIGNIIRVIDDIADQTNLLALNAAIEAARAGEQGRGFAVVADEVRKLAERSSKATREIAEMIKKIQTETKRSVSSMNIGVSKVQDGVKLAEEAKESLNTIVAASEKAVDMVQRIAVAAEQQSAAAEEVSQSMDNVSAITKKSSDANLQLNRAASDLSELASEMQKVISWFRTASV